MTIKHTFLIQHHFECKDALEGALGSLLNSILGVLGGSWCPIWCPCGLEGAPRISKTFYFSTLEPPRLRRNNFSSKARYFQKSRFNICKIAVFESEGTKIKNFQNLIKLDTFFVDPFSCYIYGVSLIYFVVVSQNAVFLVLEPLGADFDLPSGP